MWTHHDAIITLTTMADSEQCILALQDGTILRGRCFGASGTSTGEVVFNTAMTGYQEILTDPSYCGQIVTMTYPLIGNYGVNPGDVESARPHVSGFVVKELARRHSNHRAAQSLDDFLAEHNVVGLRGVDTRALARKLRVDGAMQGVITTEVDDPRQCVQLARGATPMRGADLVCRVAPTDTATWTEGLVKGSSAWRTDRTRSFNVVAIDCGMKRNILRHLVDVGCRVRIVPPTTSAAELLERGPDGVLVSNGPGDPSAVAYAIELLKGLIGKVPLFGICLGHQLIGCALGADTFKLKFGHRGANHPVLNLATGRVEITSQNHGFAIETRSLEAAGARPTHTNLNDKTLEGFIHDDMPIMAVQYHPEASPGPHDSSYLFDCFARMMATRRAPSGDEMAEAQAILQNRRCVAHEQGTAKNEGSSVRDAVRPRKETAGAPRHRGVI